MLCIDRPWRFFSGNCKYDFLLLLLFGFLILNQSNSVFSVNGGFNETDMRIVFAKLRYLVKPFESQIVNITIAMEQFQLAMKKFDYTVESLMLELMEPCASFIKHCSFVNENLPCDQLFFITKTTEGFCCSFNHKLVYNYKAYTK